MASTYSTNLKIELQATGENSGTWGTITNTNLGTALEQAIVGYGNPSFASDANLTLTYTDTNAAQAARALVLNVTSAVSLTTTRELVVPTIQKQYIVQNNTTGGQSITVKTSGGTGITVPNGRKAHLYVDGTNVIQMFDFVDINGGAIDGTTVGASSASTGAFTTLTASGATTLNGAVALGDAAADLITVPGTVNSNVIFTDNTFDIGASGATRPRTGYFATSVVTPLATVTTVNATTIDTTNLEVTNIKAKDGTAAMSIADSTGAVTISTALTANGGAVFNENGANVDFRVEGDNEANLLFVDASADAVGIGTNAPGARLELRGPDNTAINSKGNLFVSDGGTATQSAGEGGQISLGAWLNGDLTNPYAMGVIKGITESSTTNVNGGALLFGTAQSSTVVVERARITSTGTLNIVGAGTAGTNQAISFNGSTPVDTLVTTTTGVGIGTSSPAEKLQVVGNIQSKGSALSVTDVNGTNQWYINRENTLTGNLQFRYSSTSLMELTDSGNLGIGTSSFTFVASGAETGVNIKSSGVNSAGINVSSSNANNTRMEMFAAYTINQGGFYLKGDSAFPSMVFGQVNGSTFRDSMTLDASGNLGLGVTPSDWNANNKVFQLTNNASLFSRSGFTGVAQNFRYNASDTGIFMSAGYATLYYQNAGSHIWAVSTTSWSGTGSDTASLSQAMTLDASGRLMIGDTTGESKANVFGGGAAFSSGSMPPGMTLYGTTTDGRGSMLSFKANPGAQGIAGIAGIRSNGYETELRFYTNNTNSQDAFTERARITSGGNLLVGTASELIGTSRKLSVDAANNAAVFKSATAASETVNIWNSATSGDNVFIEFDTETSVTARGSITYNRAGGLVAYNTTSDYRAKDVTGPVANSGATIDALKVYNGKMKGATVERPMLVAHEAQEVTPYAVTGEKDAVDEDGKPKYQQIDVSSLVPLLIAEIQSLRARVAQLEQGA